MRIWNIGSDNAVVLPIINAATRLPFTGAAVSAIMNDIKGVAVPSVGTVSFPESANPGTYIGIVPNTAVLIPQGLYSLVVTAVGSGITKTYQIVKPAAFAGSEDPQSKYLTFDKFIGRWGLKNVTNAANKDNQTSMPDPEAVQDSFDFADYEVDQFFVGCQLVAPLDFSPYDNVIPKCCEKWASVIAYADLYEVRGFDDKNKVDNRIDRLLKRVYDEMNLYRAGIKRLPAAYRGDVSVAPLVVTYQQVRQSGFWGRYPDQQYTYLDGVLQWLL